MKRTLMLLITTTVGDGGEPTVPVRATDRDDTNLRELSGPSRRAAPCPAAPKCPGTRLLDDLARNGGMSGPPVHRPLAAVRKGIRECGQRKARLQWMDSQLENFEKNAYGFLKPGLSNMQFFSNPLAGVLAGAVYGPICGAFAAAAAARIGIPVPALQHSMGWIFAGSALLGSAVGLMLSISSYHRESLGITYDHIFASTIGRLFNTPAAQVDSMISKSLNMPGEARRKAIASHREEFEIEIQRVNRIRNLHMQGLAVYPDKVLTSREREMVREFRDQA